MLWQVSSLSSLISSFSHVATRSLTSSCSACVNCKDVSRATTLSLRAFISSFAALRRACKPAIAALFCVLLFECFVKFQKSFMMAATFFMFITCWTCWTTWSCSFLFLLSFSTHIYAPDNFLSFSRTFTLNKFKSKLAFVSTFFRRLKNYVHSL